jgi:hypothetical protein
MLQAGGIQGLERRVSENGIAGEDSQEGVWGTVQIHWSMTVGKHLGC